ncbi:hypothetical protein TWF679_009636 [Orbilia oligospora]|uniref:NACHT domain-containing protein n=1 Tax=Orbilia oligospora TaxID=2813651 RepID=A0A8H8VJ98_ORBOL|nr:hypothetical protein TWF679_009636 [Orbilia oligospora]
MNCQDYTTGWICALPLEFTAAKVILDERHPQLPQDGSDPNTYEFGRIGCCNVIIACLPFGEYGVTSAAAAIVHMRRSFPFLKASLMVGIAGGVPLPHDIRLGDVVVSKPVPGFGGVLQYDFGKTIQKGQFVQTGVLNKPSRNFLTALAKLESEHLLRQNNGIDEIITNSLEPDGIIPQEFARPSNDTDQLFQAHYDHPFKNSTSCDQCDSRMIVQRAPRLRDQCRIHYGLIASGNQVMKDGITRDRIAQEKDILAFEMEAAGIMDELPSLVIRGICDYSDNHKNKIWQPYAALSAAIFAKELLLRLPIRAGDKNNRAQRVNLNLPTAEGAAFGSYADQHEPECLEGTRVDLLSTIKQWINSPQEKAGIFWLVGGAGTGKSTISRTIARSLEEKSQLGASFFFKRGEADRSNGALFFTTIANQLATHLDGVASSIQEAIQSNPDIPGKALKEQFDKLILQPLSKIKPADFGYNARLILLIDALDECEGKEDVEVIICLLGQLKFIGTIDVRVFLTSRPDFPIRTTFKKLPEGIHQYIILHEAPKIEHDIVLFLKHELSKIRNERSLPQGWPGDQITKRLVEMATPLFIYAATMCRFLGDTSWDPEERIKELLNRQSERVSQLHGTYLPILKQLVIGQDDARAKRLIEEFRQIVGTIVNIFSPLSISSLASLLSGSVPGSVPENIVDCRLKPLYSVLNVPDNRSDPVRIFHLSFRDFLVDNSLRKENPFWVDEKGSHEMIANKCIDLMSGSAGLKRNICNLSSPGTLLSEIDKEVVEKHLAPELRYACRYWIYHLIRSGYRLVNGSQTHRFFQEHLLHWLEAASLLNIIPEALDALNTLTSFIDAENGESISKFIYDIKRFMLQNQDVLHEAPLQVYYSALIFAPRKCTIREIFDPERMITWMKQSPRVQKGWGTFLQTLEDNNGVVRAITFSSDGRVLVSGSYDKTIRLWNAPRTPPQILEGHNGYVSAITFSSDNKILGSSSTDETIKLWNTTSGTLLQTLKEHNSQVNAIAFSADSKILASGSENKVIRLWDITSGALLQTLEGHTGRICAVTFSPNSKILASSSSDTTVRLWNISGALLRILEGHNSWVNAIVFSPDGKILASGSSSTIRFWDTTSGMLLKTLKENNDRICVIAFSPDGKMLASGCKDANVRLWDAASGTLLQTLKGHNNWIRAIAFSPDGKILASCSSDRAVRLWDTSEALSQTPEEHSNQISAITFSSNGKKLASGSSDTTVKLWNTSGTLLGTLRGHYDCISTIVFSPDDTMLASGSHDGTIKLWSASGTLLKTLMKRSYNWVCAIAFSPDGKILASGFSDRTIMLWDASGVLLQTPTWLLDGPSMGSLQILARLLDVAPLQTLKQDSGMACAIAFSSDDNMLASGSHTGTIRLWNASGTLLKTLEGHDDWVCAIAFSPDGKILTSGSRDKTVRLWDAASGAPLQVFLAGGWVNRLAFSRDGRYIDTQEQSYSYQSDEFLQVSGDANQYEKIFIKGEWLTRGEERLIWLPHNRRATCSAVSDNMIALGHLSGAISFFKLVFDSSSSL